jgi:protein SCO1
MAGLEVVMRNLLILTLLILLAGCEKLPSPFHANDVSAKFSAVELHLTDHHGKTRSLSEFKGKIVLLFFGYTHCPDVCVTTLADLASVMKLLGKEADKVQVLFITIDPERDKPEILAQYIPFFDPSFLGLYGDPAATAQAAKSFYVSYQKQLSASGYNMDHSTGVYMLDAKGRVRLYVPLALRTDWIADDIRLLLAGA